MGGKGGTSGLPPAATGSFGLEAPKALRFLSLDGVAGVELAGVTSAGEVGNADGGGLAVSTVTGNADGGALAVWLCFLSRDGVVGDGI